MKKLLFQYEHDRPLLPPHRKFVVRENVGEHTTMAELKDIAAIYQPEGYHLAGIQIVDVQSGTTNLGLKEIITGAHNG